jgi:hypothetical protein
VACFLTCGVFVTTNGMYFLIALYYCYCFGGVAVSPYCEPPCIVSVLITRVTFTRFMRVVSASSLVVSRARELYVSHVVYVYARI